MGIKDQLKDDIEKAQDILSYIEELENKASKSNVEFDIVDYVVPNVSVSKLYHPKKVFIKKDKCNNCKKGFVQKDDSYYYSEYDMCDCQCDSIDYVVDEISIQEIRKNKDSTLSYIYYDNGEQIIVSEMCVKRMFSVADLCKQTYYTSAEVCEECCKKMRDAL